MAAMLTMSDEVFDILRAALTLAKKEQICTVAELRSRLFELFQNKEAKIDEAMLFWARSIK